MRCQGLFELDEAFLVGFIELWFDCLVVVDEVLYCGY